MQLKSQAKPLRVRNKIAARARFIYLGFPALAIVLMLLIGSYVSNAIADDFARRLAGQYAVEAAANFQIGINPHFVLMQQVSRSTTISRWLAYENDEEIKQRAFEEILGYAVFVPDSYIMFTSYVSLHGFDFDADFTMEQFQPWGQIRPGHPQSQWFLDTRDAELPFILNIQRTRGDVDSIYIWSNHRMYYQNNFVGVLTVGTPFDDVFDTVFGFYNAELRRGYIIDEFGLVRADSARILQTTYYGIPSPQIMPELEASPLLAEYLNSHLALKTDGRFAPGMYSYDAIPVEGTIYRYASIAPIIGTNWSIVVFSNHTGVFEAINMPMILSVLGLFLISFILGNLIVRNFVLVPLAKLTKSVEEASITDEKLIIFGTEKDDEIGFLASTIQNMRDKLHETMDERRRIQVAEESNKAKSRFLARMSHEIRTPLTAVLGISEIQLQDLTLNPRVEDSFSKIHNSASLLLRIINDILDLSKIEAGKMDILQEEYEVASLINDASNLHVAYVSSKDIKFVLNVDENLPETLIGDSYRIKQILNNLLSNAFKYTNEGEVKMNVENRPSQKENYTTLAITITDTGMGMTRQQQEKLFTEYTRFHESERNFIEGTGLGMPIVNSFLKLMNAEMELNSEVNQGTNITILIPQKKSTANVLGEQLSLKLERFEAVTTASQVRFEAEYMPYGKVLVVDDMEANLYVAKSLLEFYGLNIETCDSGNACINKIKKGNVYDIIFLDQMMPGLSGVETLEELRKLGYKEPIVALTANALAGQKEELLTRGFDDFISKPIAVKQLHAALEKHILYKQSSETIEQARAEKRNSQTTDLTAFQQDPQTIRKLRIDFAKSQRNAYANLMQALNANDTQTAHRVAHSAKGLAGIIHEKYLADIAGQIEDKLAVQERPSKELLNALESELNKITGSIEVAAEPNEQPQPNQQNHADSAELFATLEELLKTRNIESLQHLEQLKKIPETAIIVRQIEDYEFEGALANLKRLHEIFG